MTLAPAPPERPVSANPELTFCSNFCIYLLRTAYSQIIFELSLLHLRVKAQQYFVSLSYMLLDQKAVFKFWLKSWVKLEELGS